MKIFSHFGCYYFACAHEAVSKGHFITIDGKITFDYKQVVNDISLKKMLLKQLLSVVFDYLVNTNK